MSGRRKSVLGANRDAPYPFRNTMEMTLFSGHRVNFGNPQVDDIRIEDIAHSLAHLCRFGGHTKEFYSVAQHSIRVAHAVPKHLMLEGLLHDATEAYVGDMIRPLKRQLVRYQQIEEDFWQLIAFRFNLSVHMSPEVKMADEASLKSELQQFMRGEIELNDPYWGNVNALPHVDISWSPLVAKTQFLSMYEDALALKNGSL
jgi:hypothetical protein